MAEATIQEADPSIDKKSRPRTMSMAQINFWLDAALLIDAVFVMWLAAMLQMVFPPPTQAAGWVVWGLSYDAWHRVQFAALCIFAGLAIEHLVLHWNWVCTVLATQILRLKEKPDPGVQAVYGVGTLIVILVFTLATLVLALLSAHQVNP